MTTHTLKITDGWWRELWLRNKTFELRRDDRGFQVDDFIQFTDLCGNERGHSRNFWRITHVLRDVDGLQDGYVGLSLRWVTT